MTNWGGAVPIIVAIIGISGFIVPPLSLLLINQIYNKPNLDIHIGSVPAKGKTTINLTNIGTMPATNLSLILTANNKTINKITNLFSTVSITLAIPGSPDSILEINLPKRIDGSFVEIHVKKFVNGGGSIVELEVDARDTTLTDYAVYATYDQGSTKTTGGERNYFSFYLFIYLYVLIAESIVFVYVMMWGRKRRERRSIAGITEEMMDVRKALRETLSNKKIFSDIYWTTGLPTKHTHTKFLGIRRITFSYYILPIRDKRRTVRDIKDYMRIDDFYSKLAERNSYINNNQANDDIVLMELNKKCLYLADDALEKIDWSNYI